MLSTPQYLAIEKTQAVGITLADFFAEEKQELEPELRRLLETAKKLTPKQREHLQKLLETINKA